MNIKPTLFVGLSLLLVSACASNSKDYIAQLDLLDQQPGKAALLKELHGNAYPYHSEEASAWLDKRLMDDGDPRYGFAQAHIYEKSGNKNLAARSLMTGLVLVASDGARCKDESAPLSRMSQILATRPFSDISAHFLNLPTVEKRPSYSMPPIWSRKRYYNENPTNGFALTALQP